MSRIHEYPWMQLGYRISVIFYTGPSFYKRQVALSLVRQYYPYVNMYVLVLGWFWQNIKHSIQPVEKSTIAKTALCVHASCTVVIIHPVQIKTAYIGSSSKSLHRAFSSSFGTHSSLAKLSVNSPLKPDFISVASGAWRFGLTTAALNVPAYRSNTPKTAQSFHHAL